jgi:methyl-accepting chemotaxis protein
MVYEISVPILEGQIGAARVGIWEDDVNAEIGEMLAPVLKLITLVVIAGILLAVFLVRRINRPIMRLISSAERISHGDLDVPSIGTDDRSEFGELSRALERLRSSVRAAMIRLGAE